MPLSLDKRFIVFVAVAVVILTIIFGGFYFLFSVPQPDGEEADHVKGVLYPPLADYSFYPIEQLIDDWENVLLVGGNYNTIGYVARHFTCPSCPAGANCIQCQGEGLVVRSEKTDATDLATASVLILTDDYEQFRIGGQYEFSFAIDEVLQTITLLGANELSFDDPAVPDTELVADLFGHPTAYSIYFNAQPYGVERQEAWDYHNLGYTFSFVDGRYLDAFVSQDTRDSVVVQPAPLSPLAFSDARRLADVTAAIGSKPKLTTELNPVILDNTRTYVYTGGYFVTTINDVLVYIHYQ